MTKAPESPWGLVVVGAIVGIIGTAMWMYGDGFPQLVGAALVWLGWTLSTVGVVGAGVVLGMARLDWLRARERA